MALIDWTYSVTNSATAAALASVNIWVSSDIGGQTVLDTGTTGVAGTVVLSLTEDSDVYIWHSLNAYTFTNPNLQTVTSGVTGTGTGTAVVSPVPDAIILQDTALDLISDSLMECGILAQGETAQSEDANTGLRKLNKLIDDWKLERLLTYEVRIDRHVLTASQAIHTIGPSGDFVADRPVRIARANIVVIDSDTALETVYALQIYERAEEYSQITDPTWGSDVPSVLYCDYAFPDANIRLWPYPAAAYTLELYTWRQLAGFTSLTAPVSLPPGYYNAIMLTLAERLCTSFGVEAQTRAVISADAANARKKVKFINVRAPLISLRDSGIPLTESL